MADIYSFPPSQSFSVGKENFFDDVRPLKKVGDLNPLVRTTSLPSQARIEQMNKDFVEPSTGRIVGKCALPEQLRQSTLKFPKRVMNNGAEEQKPLSIHAVVERRSQIKKLLQSNQVTDTTAQVLARRKTDFMSQRYLIIALLKIIDYAEEPNVDPDVIKTHLQQINKSSEHSGQMWKVLSSLLACQNEIVVSEEGEDEIAEVNQLYWLNKLCDLALTGECLREELESANETVRRATLQLAKDKAAKKHDYEQSKVAMQKRKLILTTKDQMSTWQEQWKAAADKYQSRIQELERNLWQLQRSKQLRMSSLGQDCRGNTFWVFGHSDRVEKQDNLGNRVIIEVSPGSIHPACDRSTKGDCADCRHETVDEPDADEIPWYEVNTSTDARGLARWIMSEATARLGPKPKTTDGRSKEARVQEAGAQMDSSRRSAAPGAVVSEDRDIDIVIAGATSASEVNHDSSTANRSQGLVEAWQSIESLIKKIEVFANYMN